TTAAKSYIFWIDKKSEENIQVMNQLTNDKGLQIDFSETFSMAKDHLQRHIQKIKSSSSKFQIICRGYYRNEDKNPLDLLRFLNNHQLEQIPVIVFTQDKQGLQNHLQSQASTMGIYDWRDRLYITEYSKELITKIKANITSNLGNHRH